MALDFTLVDLPTPSDGKNNRSGKAAILKPKQLEELFDELVNERDRFLFGICYFTASRITETLRLERADIVQQTITFHGRNTKTKTTRQAAMHPTLVTLMEEYELPTVGPLFPGRHGQGQLTRQGADWLLREACERLGWVGVSTHSFRRSFVTQMAAEGKTPAQIQRYTGHKNLASLLHYFGA